MNETLHNKPLDEKMINNFENQAKELFSKDNNCAEYVNREIYDFLISMKIDLFQ